MSSGNSQRTTTIAATVLAVCAVILTALTITERLAARGAPNDAVRTQTVEQWRDFAEGGHRVGPEDAPVTVVVFGDYQCPACKYADRVLRSLSVVFAGDVAWVYRHWPLPYHDNALPAAIAIECAALDGRFEAYHTLLFDQPSLQGVDFVELAEQGPVSDLVRFRECIEDAATLANIEEDQRAGELLGVRGTPTILVNDQLILGMPDSATLARLISQQLDVAERL